MNALATRCAHCGTSFRVSEEQLAVSDGYVRCGRCDSVFNAREALFDLDSSMGSGPMPLSSRPAPLAPAEPAPPVYSAHPELDADELEPEELEPAAWPEPQEVPEPLADTPPAAESQAEPEPEPEPQWISDASADLPADARTRAEPQWDQALEAPMPPEPAPARQPLPEPAPALDDDEATDRMRELLGIQLSADASRPSSTAAPAPAWASLDKPKRGGTGGNSSRGKNSRWVLGSAGLLAALLALALPLQWAWVEREALRARFPQLDQWLEPHLPRTGWQQLDGLSVGSSSLQATPQGGAYQLELELHNRAAHALAMPWLDLSLSDAQGKLLLRRSLSPQELGADVRPLAAGGRRRVQAVFRVPGGTAPVAGYELGLFHP